MLAFIDPRTPDPVYNNLKKSGYHPIKVPLCTLVDEPISGHPDIQIFIHKNRLFVHPRIDPGFLKKIDRYCDVTICESSLSAKYPGDIAYNIACTGEYAIHRTDRTDKKVLDYLQNNNIRMIHTKQGYSKCSTMVVDRRSIITSDRSIHKSAQENSIESLLICEGHIVLRGYNHGFIGGASGKSGDTIFITGTIDHHPNRDKIYDFIETRGKNIKILSDERAMDSGSILFCRS